MGRTYRNTDKKFKRKLKEGRRVRKNKRNAGVDEHTERRPKKADKKDTVGSYLFA